VATITASGTTNASGQATVTITAVAAGTTTITATSGGTSQTATLTVTAGGGTTPTVALALGSSTITAGNTTTATATVTLSGVAQTGETVSFTSSDTGVATITATGTTDGSGEAQVTITAVAAGTTTITATSGGASATATLTVQAAASSRVLFWNATDTQFQEAVNTTGSTAQNLNLGGIFIVYGAQQNGTHIFMTNAGFPPANAQIRNLATGTNTAFSPSALDLFTGFVVGAEVAAISPDGSTVVWIRQSGGNRQLVRADLDGANEQVLVNSGAAATNPFRCAISTDGTNVAYVTDLGTVSRIAITGGAPVALNLNGSLGATALEWRNASSLAVSVDNALGTGTRGIINVPANGDPASILFNDGGTGLRSTPTSVAVDSTGRILFDELDAGGTQREIYRVDPPGLGARVNIVTRAQDDSQVYVVEY
jgi:hypothetical protein